MKIAGCILVTVFSTLIGCVFTEKEERKLCVLEELHMFINKLIGGIKSRAPLDEICLLYTSSENASYIKGENAVQITESLEVLANDGLCEQETAMCKKLLKTASRTADASEIEKTMHICFRTYF